MLLALPQVLNSQDIRSIRCVLEGDSCWRDGQASAGTQAVLVKRNQQVAQDHPSLAKLQAQVLQAMQTNTMVLSAALPRRFFTPQFNRYTPAFPAYGPHIDGAILHSRHTHDWVRSDLSCTLFLSEPDEYRGGELVIHTRLGTQRIKGAAGDAVLYPSSFVHEVTPVTAGTRLASFFWIESMVRSDEQRQLLFDLDMNLLKLRQQHGETAETIALTGIYHNLLRQWAHT